ncbi:hypothetical protein [Hyphococcus sp.]|uniref:hypothetical protein n=1 Tax=Hyphococcus sp. TaxID=2038636 RepID=UPI003CCC22D1
MMEKSQKIIKAQIADSIRTPTEKQILALLKCLRSFGLQENEIDEASDIFAKGIAETLAEITEKITSEGVGGDVSRVVEAFSKALDEPEKSEDAQ